MLQLLSILLTTILLFAILKSRETKKLKLKKIVFQQSSVHETLKYFLPTNAELRKKKRSQVVNHSERNTTKIIKTPDNKVYWVANNIFYCAEVVNGEFDPSTATPINTENLSKKQLDELLFILDNLKNG
jgi:hypothetical protein